MRIAVFFISYLLSTFLFERATIFLDATREKVRKICHNILHCTLCEREGETVYILRLCPSCAFFRVLRYRRCIRRNKFRPSKARYMQSMTFEKRRSFVAFDRLFFEHEFFVWNYPHKEILYRHREFYYAKNVNLCNCGYGAVQLGVVAHEICFFDENHRRDKHERNHAGRD